MTEDNTVGLEAWTLGPTGSPGSKEFGTYTKHFLHGSREASGWPSAEHRGRQLRKGMMPYYTAVRPEESDAVIVPRKSAKTWVTLVESMEGRAAAKRNADGGNALRTQGRVKHVHETHRHGQCR